MNLAEAISDFLQRRKLRNDAADALTQPDSLLLLADYFPAVAALEDVTPERLRDFLGRWYAEEAQSSRQGDSGSFPARIPDPQTLTDRLEQFFAWANQQAGAGIVEECFSMLAEFRQTLPHALQIAAALAEHTRQRGAFAFPEFLTSFEQGGQSRYDIDAPGDVGALDGYFRIMRVEGGAAEAEELISEATIWPVIFSEDVAHLLRPGYILNLEIIRAADGWHIADYGFVYPPGVDVMRADSGKADHHAG
ncbi:MAG TPA: hypothetical protein VNO70_19140 [Blastocatellia bacterium]|nr:hypothetical protein [Blastocatellia bacterium]